MIWRYYEVKEANYSSMNYFFLILLIASIIGCSREAAEQSAANPNDWPGETEVVFQNAEVLRYQIEQRRLEQSRLDELGVEGAPPIQ